MQREIGIIIRVKDAAKAKEEIKGIVDTKILGNVKAANRQFKKLGQEIETSGTKARQSKDSFKTLFTTLTRGTGVLYTLSRGFSLAFGSFESGAGIERASVEFERSIGRVSQVLPQLRSATRNTVDDLNLLKTANRAVMEGLDAKSLTKVFQMATVASRRLGIESSQAIQTISNAITRQDESALTTLGTILKTNEAMAVQNAIVSKTAGVMSGAAKIQIRQGIILDALNSKFKGFNNIQEDSVELIAQFRTAMTNLRASLGPIVGQLMAPALKIITTLASSLSTMLNTLKDSKTFQVAARNIGLLVSVIGGAKALGSIISLAKSVGLLTVSMKSLGMVAGGLAVFRLLGIDAKDLSGIFDKLATGASVFFQLISSYDDSTGMSQILEKDKKALGSFYNVVFTAAKMWKVLEAAGRGALRGIKEMLDFVAPALGPVGSALQSVLNSIINGEPLLQSALNRIEETIKLFTQFALGGLLTGLILTSAAFGKIAIGVTVFLGMAKGIGIIAALAAAFKTLALWAGASMMAMGPIGWALLAGGAAVGITAGVAALSSASPSDTSDSMGGNGTPDLRQQNIQSVTQDESMLVKVLKDLLNVNERMDAREEEKGMRDRVRVSPQDQTFLRR